MNPPASYPSDVSDDEWAFVAPWLILMTEDAPQRAHPLRAIFNGLRWLVRAGVFEAIVQDLRRLLHVIEGRPAEPSAVILDSRTLQSTPESGARSGCDGAKRRKGDTVHLAVDTLGHLLRRIVSRAALIDERRLHRVARRHLDPCGQPRHLRAVLLIRHRHMQGQQVARHGIALEVVKLPQVKKGFVLLTRRWRGFISWRSPSSC